MRRHSRLPARQVAATQRHSASILHCNPAALRARQTRACIRRRLACSVIYARCSRFELTSERAAPIVKWRAGRGPGEGARACRNETGRESAVGARRSEPRSLDTRRCLRSCNLRGRRRLQLLYNPACPRAQEVALLTRRVCLAAASAVCVHALHCCLEVQVRTHLLGVLLLQMCQESACCVLSFAACRDICVLKPRGAAFAASAARAGVCAHEAGLE